MARSVEFKAGTQISPQAIFQEPSWRLVGERGYVGGHRPYPVWSIFKRTADHFLVALHLCKNALL
jgi:hypothetical protein